MSFLTLVTSTVIGLIKSPILYLIIKGATRKIIKEMIIKRSAKEADFRAIRIDKKMRIKKVTTSHPNAK